MKADAKAMRESLSKDKKALKANVLASHSKREKGSRFVWNQDKLELANDIVTISEIRNEVKAGGTEPANRLEFVGPLVVELNRQEVFRGPLVVELNRQEVFRCKNAITQDVLHAHLVTRLEEHDRDAATGRMVMENLERLAGLNPGEDNVFRRALEKANSERSRVAAKRAAVSRAAAATS